ncbi:MAG: PadR family transcriptional regulator [Telmatospirillum sp.]|nr:PadR family transcriptional regulator [Telmatospirillum sp.]
MSCFEECDDRFFHRSHAGHHAHGSQSHGPRFHGHRPHGGRDRFDDDGRGHGFRGHPHGGHHHGEWRQEDEWRQEGGALDGRSGHGRRDPLRDRTALALLILHLVGEQPAAGVDIMAAIEARFPGSRASTPDRIYPVLAMLEELGQISRSDGADGHKRYLLTAEGESHLAANRALVDAVIAKASDGGASAGEGRERIIRAMHNLKAALHLRLGRRSIDATELDRIVGLLDRTAGDIERD